MKTIRKFCLETLSLYSVFCTHNHLEKPCPTRLSLSYRLGLMVLMFVLWLWMLLVFLSTLGLVSKAGSKKLKACSLLNLTMRWDAEHCASVFMLF